MDLQEIEHWLPLIKDAIADGFDDAARERQRPSTLLRPSLSLDGNQWCALYGADLQEGLGGFGSSPHEAFLDFDKEFFRTLKATEEP